MSECKDLKPTFCGQRGLDLPSGGCSTVRIEGADDVSINQGVCIDLTEGVHAYDGDGSEIEYTVSPSEIGCCDVGEHEVTYKAVGKGSELVPSFCMSTPMLHMPDCGIVTKTVKRIVTILQALPPKILGIERKILPSKGTFDALEDVYGIDDNGEETVVTFNGVYDDATSGDLITVDSVGGDSRSLKVTLEPIQDLNGYDKPWSGGNGKNKLQVTATSKTLGGITFTVNSDGSIKADGTASGWGGVYKNAGRASLKANTQYTLYAEGGISSTYYLDLLNGTTKLASTEYGSRVTFTPTEDVEATLDVCVYYNKTVNAQTMYPMLCLASETDASFAPYSNICPISGRTECVTEVCGKNLWNPNGEFSLLDCYLESGTAQRRVGREVHLPTGTYTVKLTLIGQSGFIYMNKVNKSGAYLSFDYLSTGGNGTAVTVTLSDGDYLLVFDQQASSVGESTHFGGYNIQLELGSSATSYEPYQGTTYTTSLGRTVYGGTLDVVSGVLTDKMAMADLGTFTWQKYGTYSNMDRYVSAGIDSTAKDGETNAICSIYPLKWGANGFVIGGGSVKLSVLTELGQYSSVADFKTAMNGVQLVYELATPQTIQLTPQEVELLTGTNNVWSDGVYHPLVKRHLKNNSWTVQALNGVTYFVNQGYGYMTVEPFASAPMFCSHFKVTRNVTMPTSTSTPLADNGVYLTTNGRLLVRYDAVNGADISESRANWLEFIEDNNVYLTVPSYGDTEDTSLHILDLGYPKQMPSGEFMFQYDGVYEVTYDTKDSCGNHTTETRLIYVGDDWSEDSFSPMTCLGKACAMTLECSEDLPIVCHGTVCNAKLTCVEE